MPRTRSQAYSEDEDKYNQLLRITEEEDEEREEEEEEEEEIQANKKIRVKVRGSTKMFVDALKPLEPERREWLKETPFHKLLDMHRDVQKNGLIRNFASTFNTQDNSFEINGETHVITLEDVSRFLGIEDGDDEEEIEIPKPGQQTKVRPDIIKEFVRKRHMICIDKVKTKLRDSWDKDTLKRAYMLLALQYIIFPLPDRAGLQESYLHLVEDVTALSNKRWATLVIKSLVNGIYKYNNYKGNKQVYIGGCALLLQLCATNGSITSPPEYPKKKTRDKEECSGSSSRVTMESSILEAMDTTRTFFKGAIAAVRNFYTTMKVNKSQIEVINGNLKTSISVLASQRDTTLATFQRSLDEHMARDARREDPQDINPQDII